MNCKYYYGKHRFDSEIELDDFLLDGGPELIEKYGDEAFSERSVEQLDNNAIVEPLGWESYKLKQDPGKESYNPNFLTNQVEYKGAYAVTKFLEGLKEGKRLMFPEFIEENYFENRKNKWKLGEYSEKELQDFSEEPEFLNGLKPQVLSEDLINRLIAIEKAKWKDEANVGTAIHKLCEIYFSRYDFTKEKSKEPNFGIWGDKSDEEILKKFDKAGTIVNDFLNADHKKSTLEYCKQLRATIESRFGGGEKNFIYYPELRIKGVATNPETGDEVNLIGTIDLLVIPPKGTPFMVDYKVSPADYWTEAKRDIPIEELAPTDYSTAKKRAFRYQLATYGRMLRLKSSTFTGMAICVAPIQLLNYHKKDDRWRFEGIRTDVNLLDVLSGDEQDIRVQLRLDSIFSDISAVSMEDKKVLLILMNLLKAWFTKYDSKTGNWSLQEVNELMTTGTVRMEENREAMNEDMRFSYKVDGKTIYASSKALLCAKVLSLLNSYTSTLKNRTIAFKDAVKHKSYSGKSFTNKLEHDTGNADFYKDFLTRYVESGEYEVIDNGVPKAFEALGIVLLKNKISKNIEVIKLTTQSITRRFDPTNKNKLITQCFASDIVDKSSKNFLLDAVNGNVELLEALLAVNLIPRVFRREQAKIHSILLINPYINSGLTASNKQLLYAYKTMLKYRNLNQDLGKNNIFYSENQAGDIQLCTAAELALDVLRTGISITEREKGLLSQTALTLRNKCLTPLEDVIINEPKASSKLEDTVYEAIVEMQELDKSLKTRQLKAIDFSTPLDDIQLQYLALLRAYAEIKGYDFKQLVQAYSNYLDSFAIPLEGHSGLRTDNPGTTASDNLNKVTEFIDDCYKRVTDSMQRPHALSQELIKKLKKRNGISYIGDSTFLNSVRIYENMTKVLEDGDWVFVNPFDEVNVSLTPEERNFLKFAVTKINSNRFRLRGETDEKFEKRLIKNMNEGKIEWIRVPLAYKGTLGKLETLGLFLAAKDYFYSFMPTEIKKRLKLKFSHLFTPEGKLNRDDVYAMRTLFDYGEDPTERMRMLAERRYEYDHDLLSVLLKHLFGYSLKNESEKAFTLIKSAYAEILLQEFTQSRENEAEKQYLMDNVKIMTGNKLMSDKELLINEYASKIMKMASVFALGFSPKQLYQLLEGIYKDIGIVWRNEDGRYGFTFKEMLISFADVYKEMGKFGYTPTKLERLNLLYRINDMDINVYAQHLQNSHNLVKNFSSFLFRFASRPDFYNRMTIFESYMRHDGTFDAYELNKEGELEYHFEKDSRFSLLLSGDKLNSEEYYKLESLYIAMGRQFEREGARYADGTEYKVERDSNGKWKPLPLAYTNKQARSYKSMADKMYGYYSHEKKALMQSSLIGALFWQMNTYWSGKKNQWFAISSVKDRGNFTHYSEVALDENGQVIIENGKEKRNLYYYQVDESGVPLYDAAPVTYEELKNKSILVPFYLWEGNFSEGIAVTLTGMLWDALALGLYNKQDGFIIEPKGNYSDIFEGTGILDKSRIYEIVRDQYWNNPNENLRTAYRQNIKLFVYDMSVLWIIGGIVGGQIHKAINVYTNDHKDDHSIELGMMRSALALSESIFKSATLDFDPTESIGGRGVNWTPFAISQMTRTFKTWSRVITGDTSLADGLLNTFTFNRYTLKPFIKQVTDKSLKNSEDID